MNFDSKKGPARVFFRLQQPLGSACASTASTGCAPPAAIGVDMADFVDSMPLPVFANDRVLFASRAALIDVVVDHLEKRRHRPDRGQRPTTSDATLL